MFDIPITQQNTKIRNLQSLINVFFFGVVFLHICSIERINQFFVLLFNSVPMRKLISFLCLFSCLAFTSLSAQCAANPIATNVECLPTGGWIVQFSVLVTDLPPDGGWTATNVGIVDLQPYNSFVEIGPFTTLDSVVVITELFGLGACQDGFTLISAPECFTGGNCNFCAEVTEVNCGFSPPGFMVSVEISGTAGVAQGWISPNFGYSQTQPFGTYEFGPFETPTVSIPILPVSNTIFTQINVFADNPCDDCPLQLFVQDSVWADCGSLNGSITFIVEGTQGDYQISYQGDNGQTGSVTNTNVVGGLGVGCYDFQLSDATDFCTGGATFCLPGQSDIVITTTTEQQGCNESFITATVTGGTPPYAYTWNNGAAGSVAGPLPAGFYRLTVTDATGCTQTTNVSVNNSNIFLEVGDSAVINATCGLSDGAINPDVSATALPLSYLWSNGATMPVITGLAAGTYALTVTDANGCFAVGLYSVGEEAGFNVNIISDSDFPALCEPGQTVTLTATVNNSESTPDYLFSWFNDQEVMVATTQSFIATEPGFYRVEVSNDPANNCTQIDRILVFGGDSGGELDITFNAVDSLQGFCQLFLQANYNGLGFVADWLLPNGQTITAGSIDATSFGVGLYTITLYPPNGGCPLTGTALVQPEDLTCVNLNGTVFLDALDDCNYTGTQTGMSNQLVQLTNTGNADRVFYAYTDQNGNWATSVPVGTYSVSVIAPNELFIPCAPQTVVLNEFDFIPALYLGLSPQGSCPRVTVDLNIPRIRRCFNSPVYIYYENTGTAVSENTVVTVEFGDWIDSVIPGFGNNPTSIVTDPITGIITATWNIGDLAPFSRGTLSLLAYTCNGDATINSAACVTATVSPNNPCPPADADWTGASLRVEGDCQGDDVVFRLRNVGTGDMSIGLQYVVVEDGVIIMPNQTDNPLTAGSELEVILPANGRTYHLQATQEPLHPGLQMPIDFVEGCGTGTTSLGFALQFPVSDDAYWIDEDCVPVIGAYDPNDKMAEPKGYAAQNYIVADQPIDYQIRFQNTGNDTAFLVVIRDTISELLDMSTFQLLSSTHDVKVSIDSSNGIAFIFEDIMLPDSFVNEPASNGAISYRISPIAGLNPGTEIENTAHIYFDFNEAVITNTYLHTVEEDFVAVSVFDFSPTIERLMVYPNPTSGPARIQLPAALEGETLELSVIDALGRILLRYNYRNGECPEADLANLPAGWYTLRLMNAKAVVGTGRVLLE